MRKIYFLTAFAVLSLLFLISLPTCNAQILGWRFTSPNSNGNETSAVATTVHPNLKVSTLVRGEGLVAPSSTLVRTFVSIAKSDRNLTATKNMAIQEGMYLEFKIEAEDGYYTSLTTIESKLRRSGTPSTGAGYIWRYSLDGINFADIGAVVNYEDEPEGVVGGEGKVQNPIDLSGIAELQNIPSTKSITLRLYVWGFPNATTHSFAVGRVATGSLENVLSIGGKVSNTLPVRFSEVKTRLNNNGVDVLWNTSFEKNNDYFEVQRSANSSDFYKIGRVNGGENSDLQQTYSFQDLNPEMGINYYRIKQVDFDGGFIYSPIAVQKFSAEIVRPLTVQVLKEQQLLKVTLNSSYNGLVPLEVAGIDGRVVYKEDFKLEKGVNTLVLSLKAKSGIYILRTKIDHKATATKFIY